jgi:hypothetical protein
MGKARDISKVLNGDGLIVADDIAAGVIPAQILTPTNTSPANAATNQTETPTLTASTFYSLYGFTHSKSQWQVSTVSNFATTVVSTGDVDNLTSYTISAGVLSTSTTYYWRVRYKDSNGSYSAYSTATTFTTSSGFAYSVEVLVVAGGGGGTRTTGAGGSGAGGYLEGSMTLDPSTAYTVTVGAGGSGGGSESQGTRGSDSVFNGATAKGGGVGALTGVANALNGGSGGGAGGASVNGTNRSNAAGIQGNSGGLTGYGNAGGSTTGNTWYIGSGGGGAAAVGENCGSVDVRGGAGGNGRQWVDGNYYAGGGGGGSESTAARAAAALGGGGLSGRNGDNPTSGTANTGGGAGGTGINAQTVAQGGSGVVILRYAGAQRGTGGTVTSSGGYTYHTFTTSGTYNS